MSATAAKLGYWSALICACLFVLFTIAFVGVAITAPPFEWTTLDAYIERVNSGSPFFLYLAQASMLIFAPMFVVLLHAIVAFASDEKKILAEIGRNFGSLFALLISINYFVQLSSVRQNIAKGQFDGLQHFVQVNPSAPMLALNMLGWTLFFGLASLFLAPIFSGNPLQNTIRYALIANGCFTLFGGIGFIFESAIVVFLTINFGMGGTILIATVALTRLFRQLSNP